MYSGSFALLRRDRNALVFWSPPYRVGGNLTLAVHNLPYHAAPFVDRVSEVAEITSQLKDADCRLLTLVGPGGIGKTRLAIRAATSCAGQFDDGVYFVPLQPLNSPEFIVSAIIDVVSF